MKRKGFFLLVEIILFFTSFLTQVAHGEPPKKIPLGNSSSTFGASTAESSSSSEEKDSGELYSDGFDLSFFNENNNRTKMPYRTDSILPETYQISPLTLSLNDPDSDTTIKVFIMPIRLHCPQPETGQIIPVGYIPWYEDVDVTTGCLTTREFEFPEATTSEIQIEGGIKIKYTGINPLPTLFTRAKNDGIQTICREQIDFGSGKVEISGDPSNHPKLYFERFNIYSGEVTFENIDIRGRINLRNLGNVTFKNCTLDGSNIDSNKQNESFIKLNEKSSATFENCKIQGNSKANVLVGSGSKASFYDCTISNTSEDGLEILATAYAGSAGDDYNHSFAKILIREGSRNIITIDRCKFLDCRNSAVFLLKNSDANITDSEFLNTGRGAHANSGSCANIINSNFNGLF